MRGVARMTFRGLIALAGTGLTLGAPAAERGDEELRTLAAEAYQAGHIETGHLYLLSLIHI